MAGGAVARLGAFLERLGPALAGLVALGLVLLLLAIDPVPMQRMQMQFFDAYQRAAPWEGSEDAGVAVVDIDEESIVRLGQWPWPRTDLATLTRRLGEAGAAAVAYDIVFSESDRTSPEALAQRYSGNAVAEELAALPSHDELFAESFAGVPVVLAYFLERGEMGRAVEPRMGIAVSGGPPTGYVETYRGALPPVPVLEEAAASTGFVSLNADDDGLVRRVPLVAYFGETLVPSLSLEEVRVAIGAGSPNLLTSTGSGETSFADSAAAVAMRLDSIEIPLNSAGEMWVHYPAEGSRAMLPAWRIIGGDMTDAELAEAVEGRIVLVGGSAVGLQDLISTPLAERTAGVNAHAAAIEQMLAGHFLERPDWARALEGALVILLGVMLALILPRLGAALGALAALAGVGGVMAMSWFAFTNAQYLLDPTWPLLAIVAVYAVQTVAVFYREERQRSYIHSAFDRYLSPELVRQIAADPHKLELGGEERDMSVLMCDIRGFSRISERYSPHEVIDFLITFLTPLSEALLARKATLDKYMGDAILAFWNAPLDDPDHPANAARAALEMIALTEELNRTMPESEGTVWPGEVKIGVGINAGTCCVGNMGSRKRLAYTLIGDTVNVASRLEGLTKLYGVPIAVGETLTGRLEEFALLELDRVRVVGRDRPATISALLGDEAMASGEDFQRLRSSHLAMLEAYRMQDWDRALAALEAGKQDYEGFGIPGLYALFNDRIAGLRADPPGEGWDGVYQATSK
ncbi:CHASE2 domain-containing protein [Alteraurantiacibacter aquimixticola]|uniref:Adenylate/guanylate cyclase domain-containing protein n=1 Tax=Alteraurantiacibacter aquimixticola TaxID=2489173 RepID=A0A4V4U8P4_9SPHN|nr:adenylate/guanylate cyclase domain-containing protein [Alteraurantiacibacter aquimixticola]TIX50733.1 adenylate/guanylate cyclase domain-containing protein [Alteraurantiacibacter aquimixticola]